MNYTYILRCGDGSLYSGWTNNLEKRLRSTNRDRARNIPELICRSYSRTTNVLIPKKKPCGGRQLSKN